MLLNNGQKPAALLLSNLWILDIVTHDVPHLTLQIISSENTLHALFRAMSPEETKDHLIKENAITECS
jgi:hypothetical protein